MTARIIFIVAGAVAVVIAMWGIGKLVEAKQKENPSEDASSGNA